MILRALRPWQVACIGLLLTLVAIVIIPRPAPAYWIRAEVLLVPPNADNFGNGLRSDSGQAVLFAAAVEREVNGDPTYARAASDDATLYGMGVSEGVGVALSNAGGQWQTSFSRPVLIVQAVSRDPRRARAEFDGAVDRIAGAVTRLQSASEVPSSALVRTSVAPAEPAVVQVVGSRKREMMAELMLGLVISLALASAWSRRRERVTVTELGAERGS